MDAFKELIYPAEMVWGAWIKSRAMLDPSSVTPMMLLDTPMEIWQDDDAEEQNSD
jgi:hypothetical protein